MTPVMVAHLVALHDVEALPLRWALLQEVQGDDYELEW